VNINLDFVNARRALLPMGNKLGLYLIGCGGTGSWLAPAVARIARMASEKGQEVRVTFIDPDTVEEKNCYRQNFSFVEIGRNKAETLAYRYGLAWGVDIRAIPTRFEFSKDANWGFQENNLNLLIGCVDRASGRRAIHRYITEYNGYTDKRWWLDCGNEQSTGQILLGNVSAPKPEVYSIPSCSKISLPQSCRPGTGR
jgi:PRTRC genetic system ThiF family protein